MWDVSVLTILSAFPGTQINARFTGTSLKLWAKPQSGYFMAQIDEAEPFKVAFMGQRDSVVTLATALSQGEHTIQLMYVIEGYDLKPDFRGFILDKDAQLLPPPELPERTIEFIGNSITCGYGNEAIVASDPFEYETENHYLTYGRSQWYWCLSQLWWTENGYTRECDDNGI